MLYSVNSPYYRQFLSSTVNKYLSIHAGNTKRTSRNRPQPELRPSITEATPILPVSECDFSKHTYLLLLLSN